MPRSGVRVDVEEQPSSHHWRVRYDLSSPVSAIEFPNTRKAFRRDAWTIIEPAGARWEIRGGHDAIIFAVPSSQVIVEFSDDFSQREKDYLLNVAFTDGSRMLYTGHLRISDAHHDWRFHSSRNRTIRVLDRSGDDQTIHRRVVEAANECIVNIGDTSLSTTIERGRSRNAYSCGLVTQWIAAARTGDAWKLFRTTFDRKTPYTTADYLSSLRAMTSSPEAVEQLVSGQTERADLFLAEQLRLSGIAARLVPVDQATATQSVLRNALGAVVKRCGCRTSIEPFCSGGTRIETIDGVNARFKPEMALARIFSSIESGEGVTVNTTPMRCTADDLDGHFRQLLMLED